uniref:Uncharacterized protein n=1 Tax=Glossina austeni TaxID=7395 RepID=A0A1A9VC36_GLOAU
MGTEEQKQHLALNLDAALVSKKTNNLQKRKIHLFSGLQTTYPFLAATTDVFEVCQKPLNVFKIYTQNNRTTNTITALSTFQRKRVYKDSLNSTFFSDLLKNSLIINTGVRQRTMALEPEVACHSLETFKIHIRDKEMFFPISLYEHLNIVIIHRIKCRQIKEKKQQQHIRAIVVVVVVLVVVMHHRHHHNNSINEHHSLPQIH